MHSAGNDIVSLAEIDMLRTRAKPFYSKILSVTEVGNFNQLVSPAIPFEHYVWLLWAMKEAAYKFLKRINPDIKFIPVNFLVKGIHNTDPSIGEYFDLTKTDDAEINKSMIFRATVEIGVHTVYAAAFISDNAISSVTSGNYNFDHIFYGLKTITDSGSDNQSSSARKFLNEAVAKVTGFGALTLFKNAHGVPFLHNEGTEVPIPVSISHHGRYIGYSFKFSPRSVQQGKPDLNRPNFGVLFHYC
jgi:phosphopantetheinyl transferase (holo-ACP synthase)